MRYTKGLTLAFITLVEARSNLRYRGQKSLQKDGINSAIRTARTLEHDTNVFTEEISSVSEGTTEEDNGPAQEPKKEHAPEAKEGDLDKQDPATEKEGDLLDEFKDDKDRPAPADQKGEDKPKPAPADQKGEDKPKPAPAEPKDKEDIVATEIKEEGGKNGEGNCCP